MNMHAPGVAGTRRSQVCYLWGIFFIIATADWRFWWRVRCDRFRGCDNGLLKELQMRSGIQVQDDFLICKITRA